MTEIKYNGEEENLETCIYFDNAATTYPKPEEVYTAMDEANRSFAVNAGRGSYALARKVSSIISETKEQIIKLANANDVAEVVFTASATLASNQIFGGVEWKKEDVVYVTPYEHNAVMRVLHHFQKQYGFSIEVLEFNKTTNEINLEKAAFQFTRKAPTVLALTHVSNVMGYVVPMEEIVTLAKDYNPIVVIDGAQALGLLPLNLRNTAIDFYIFAGHKTPYGPFGIGGYIQNSSKKLNPYLAGGTGSDSLNLEMTTDGTGGYEPGSPNIVAIAGLHAALATLQPEKLFEQEQKLTTYLVENLEQISGVTTYTPKDSKHQVGIVAFNIEGYQASDVGMILDQDYNIAVRTGYQCAPFIHRELEDEDHLGVVRASLGRYTTKEEIDILVNAVREIAEG